MKKNGDHSARQLYDRNVPAAILDEWTQQTALPKPARTKPRAGVLLVRAGDEWLALPAGMVDAARPAGPVHSVPRLSNDIFPGLTNVDGELLPCIRLAALVGAKPGLAPAKPRMVAVNTPTGRFALLVDEAAGTCGYLPEDVRPLPTAQAFAPRSVIVAVVALESRNAGLLGEAELGQALLGSLRP